MIRALLCDDESLAVDRLAAMIGRIEGVEVVGVATNGQAALDAIAATSPDVVLLDIEMPALDGFDVVEELGRRNQAAPLIVFVTAYPQFAAHAFDTGATDFLTKPVRLGRLQTMVQRVRAAIEDRDAQRRLHDLVAQLSMLREERRGNLSSGNYLWVPRHGETVRVNLDLVDWVAAEGEYVRLHVGETSYLHREPISSIIRRLDGERFLRIHRSYIINRDCAVSIRRRATGGYRITLTNGQELAVGRSFRAQVQNIIHHRLGDDREDADPRME
ncbi:MAG: hypothetical protein B7Y43_16750 [Sphingomonas sp. 28-62-20]|uniref:LytR/AlgR family response regulator transcription factor n=1 Tax=Sphingomonas sp. 28-62-20 TaxID=1970433 RepID=UPI000BDCF7B3|nr:MAG: hypothetical protein B7Y43_16750 [Sphingomonas sp. 28-62-20]